MLQKRRFWPAGKFGRTKNGVFEASYRGVAWESPAHGPDSWDFSQIPRILGGFLGFGHWDAERVLAGEERRLGGAERGLDGRERGLDGECDGWHSGSGGWNPRGGVWNPRGGGWRPRSAEDALGARAGRTGARMAREANPC